MHNSQKPGLHNGNCNGNNNGNGNGNGTLLSHVTTKDKVTNQADAPLITSKDSASNMAAMVMTGMDGMYMLTNLPSARCMVKKTNLSEYEDDSPLGAITVILEPGECDKNNNFVDKQKGSLTMSLVATTASGGCSNGQGNDNGQGRQGRQGNGNNNGLQSGNDGWSSRAWTNRSLGTKSPFAIVISMKPPLQVGTRGPAINSYGWKKQPKTLLTPKTIKGSMA